MKARLLVRFTVSGRAEPRGSKTIGKAKNGRTFIRDDNPHSKAWMQRVAKAGRQAMGKVEATDLPCVLVVTIYRPRPKGHFGSRGLLLSAAAYPATKPDLTKCIRGIEDALNDVVWTDDSRVVEQRTKKRFGDREEVLVEVFTLPATMRDGAVQADEMQQKTLIQEVPW